MILIVSFDCEFIFWVIIEFLLEFYGEGVFYGDFNKDGVVDVVLGLFWYEGFDFLRWYEYCLVKVFDLEGYFDNFLIFVYDFNSDGWDDILIVGWFGYCEGYEYVWYENIWGEDGNWLRYDVFWEVDNELFVFGNLVGDDVFELIFYFEGYFGWVVFDFNDFMKFWSFYCIFEDFKLGCYVYGLGFGDINGDGWVDFV